MFSGLERIPRYLSEELTTVNVGRNLCHVVTGRAVSNANRATVVCVYANNADRKSLVASKAFRFCFKTSFGQYKHWFVYSFEA